MNTKVTFESGAILLPALSTSTWELSVANRILIFRDHRSFQGELSGLNYRSSEGGGAMDRTSQAGAKTSEVTERILRSDVRFAGVLKAQGQSIKDCGGLGKVAPFVITSVRVLLSAFHNGSKDLMKCLRLLEWHSRCSDGTSVHFDDAADSNAWAKAKSRRNRR
jgi:hypothetical protein